MKSSSTLDIREVQRQVAAELADPKAFEQSLLQLSDDDLGLSDDAVLEFSSEISKEDEKPQPAPAPVKKPEPI